MDPHLPKNSNSNCTTMLMARRVEIVLSGVVGLYLAPHLPKNSNCKTMMMARRVEIVLSGVVGLYLASPTCLRTPTPTAQPC